MTSTSCGRPSGPLIGRALRYSMRAPLWLARRNSWWTASFPAIARATGQRPHSGCAPGSESREHTAAQPWPIQLAPAGPGGAWLASSALVQRISPARSVTNTSASERCTSAANFWRSRSSTRICSSRVLNQRSYSRRAAAPRACSWWVAASDATTAAIRSSAPGFVPETPARHSVPWTAPLETRGRIWIASLAPAGGPGDPVRAAAAARPNAARRLSRTAGSSGCQVSSVASPPSSGRIAAACAPLSSASARTPHASAAASEGASASSARKRAAGSRPADGPRPAFSGGGVTGLVALRQPVGHLLDAGHHVVVERADLVAVDVDLRVDALAGADEDHQLGARLGAAGEIVGDLAHVGDVHVALLGHRGPAHAGADADEHV